MEQVAESYSPNNLFALSMDTDDSMMKVWGRAGNRLRRETGEKGDIYNTFNKEDFKNNIYR